MATIEERKCADGSVSYRVRWAEGGRHGTKPVETFNTATHPRAAELAETFALLVNAAGQRRPTDEQLRAWPSLAYLATSTAPAGAVTVAEMCSRYIDARERNLVDAPEADTIDLYRGYVRKYIEPRALGRRDCSDPALTYRDIDEWQNELLTTVCPGGRTGLGKRSVQAVRSQVLSPAFKWACGPKGALRLAANPMTYSTSPRPDPSPTRPRLYEGTNEYPLLIATALDIDPEFGAMVALAAATGVRNGEYRQLRPPHCDESRTSINVAERVTGARRVQKGSKNKSTREVPVPFDVWDRFVAPRLDPRRPFVFLGPRGGQWQYGTEHMRWEALRERMAAAGVARAITPHSLRHGYVTYMTSHLGEAKTAILVGHRKRGMTAHYTELSEADRARARELVTALLRLT